jgi:NAD(P)-dependent dehydrogenase (short-subunit alcohol dehydrogenase family)
MNKARGRLEGKVAIVTGAGSVGPGWGNGRATTVRFAEEGARVFAVDKDADSMEETLERAREAGGEVTPYACDVTDSQAIAGLVEACTKRYGGIDILVNNVGGPVPGGPVRLSEEDWRKQIDINLTSVFLMCKQVMPVMEARGGESRCHPVRSRRRGGIR